MTASASTPRACGSCSLCCKVYPFPEIGKPAGQWCQHHVPGRGCGIHPTKPDGCRRYQCAWTQSLKIGDAWKPDVARFVMDINETQLLIIADPDLPDAWKREPYYSAILKIAMREKRPFVEVLVFDRGRLSIVFPEAQIDLGPSRPGAAIDSGYEMKDGRRIPYARYADSGAA